MRTILIIIGITAEILLIGLILLYLGIRIWLYARFDNVVKDLNYSEYVNELKSTPALPDEVFEAYERIHQYDERTTTNLFLTSLPLQLLANPNEHHHSCG